MSRGVNFNSSRHTIHNNKRGINQEMRAFSELQRNIHKLYYRGQQMDFFFIKQ